MSSIEDFAGLEQRRIIHCCRLEVLNGDDRCVEILEDIGGD